MDYSAYATAYARDGFVVVRRFLTSSELSQLRFEIDRFLHDVVPSLPAGQALYQVEPDGRRRLRQVFRMNSDPFFETCRHNSKWLALARALVGEPVTARPPIWFDKPADGGRATPPHQDNCAFALDPPHATMVLLALELMDEENGCLRYVTGSHREGMRHHVPSGVPGFALEVADYGSRDRAREVAVPLEPGDVVCHHPVTIHRASPNRAVSRSRMAFAMNLWGESARVDQAMLDRYERAAREA